MSENMRDCNGINIPEVTMHTKWGKENRDRILKRVNPSQVHPEPRNTPAGIKAVKDAFSSVFLEGEKVEELPFSENERRTLQIDLRDRTVYESGKEKVLLKNIKVEIQDGEMVLILAGSGAGKTTFIDAVMGNEKANATIFYGGIDLYKDYARLRHFISSVPQSNILRENDTVYMTLRSAAELKLPVQSAQDQAQLERKIQEVLETVNLTSESNKLVSKLSGGQKRRLVVAVEYIADPCLFFLDEADSSLDGSQARILMSNLRSIADKGKIVVVITHSPDRARDLFDKVIVLAKSSADNCGRLAFFGTPAEAMDFFEVSELEKIVEKVDGVTRDENGNIHYLADRYIDRFAQLRAADSHCSDNNY